MTMRIKLLLTGNELLSGDTVDTNSTFIAGELSAIGLRVERKTVIGDDMKTIMRTLKELGESSDVVIVNGGLGSTVDDLTAEAVSRVLGRPLKTNEEAKENIRKRYGKSISDENDGYFKHLIKQTLLPEGVTAIPNPVGLAVGFKTEIAGAVFYFTPGVPREMKVMVTDYILLDIKSIFQIGESTITRKIRVSGVGESRIQQIINENIPKSEWQGVDLGFRAGVALVEVKLTIDNQSKMPVLNHIEEKLRSLFRKDIVEPGATLQEAVVGILKERGGSLLTIDYGSAGQLAGMINSVENAGEIMKASLQFSSIEESIIWQNSSEQFRNQIPSHSNSSFEALVKAFLEKSGLDWVLAASPIELKPVNEDGRQAGKLMIIWGTPDLLTSREFLINRDSDLFYPFIGIAALDMLRRSLLDYPTDTPYYFDELSRDRLGKM